MQTFTTVSSRKQDERSDQMKSLAIEREFGSGGREIGIQVAKTIGIPYYDGELLKKVAQEQGVSVGMIEDFDEKRSGSLLFDIAAYMNYAQGENKNTVYELFYGMQKTMQNLERKEPAVFIGRCCTEILKESRKVLRVYIYSSDISERLKRIVRTEGISETEARKLMEKKDKQRKNYFKYWTEKDWADRKNYDMELNTSMLSVEECAGILLHAMQH